MTLPPERLLERYQRAIDGRTPDGMRDLISEDWTLVDHRLLPWEALRGQEAAAELNRSFFKVWEHAQLRIDEVVAVDEHAIAFRGAWHGPSKDGGGEAEIAVGFVWILDQDRIARMDIYEPDDREAMLTRFATATSST